MVIVQTNIEVSKNVSSLMVCLKSGREGEVKQMGYYIRLWGCDIWKPEYIFFSLEL